MSTTHEAPIPDDRRGPLGRYLDLLKRSLTNAIYDDDHNTMPWSNGTQVPHALGADAFSLSRRPQTAPWTL